MYSILRISILPIILILLFGGCNNQPPASSDESSSSVTETATPILEQKVVTGTRIIFVTHGAGSGSFWGVVKRGADRAAEDFDITVDYYGTETFDLELMSRMIEEAVAAKPDGLVISIPDAVALAPAIKKATEAEIPFISINVGQEAAVKLGALTHVGQMEYEAGFQSGKRLAEAGVQHGFCVNQEVGNQAIDARCQGFTDAMLEAGGIADTLAVDQTDLVATQQRIDMALDAISTIDGILTGGSSVGLVALESLKKKNLLDKVKLATFDLSPQVIEAIQNKEMLFAVDQQQYLQGYLPVMLLHLYLANTSLPVDSVTPTGPSFVTIENVDAVSEATKKGTR
jgi:simple sugar transport system substrate-binding protein